MPNPTLTSLSDELAGLAAGAAGSVVQVLGARRPATGIVHGADTIVTTARAIGREDGLRVTLPAARAGDTDVAVDADLAGWDPASGIVVLRTRRALDLPSAAVADAEPRTGQLVLAFARSWSNALTASAGIVAIVGGPLRTGRRREIARVIRVTAPMHDGFAGGALVDAAGRLAGVTTASVIRGYGVAIPAQIAWSAAARILSEGTPQRGFIGIAVQPVELPASQRAEGRERGLLVVGITPGGPAERAGLIVGDVLVALAGTPTSTTEELFDQLAARRVGEDVVARILRGGEARDVRLTVAERARG